MPPSPFPLNSQDLALWRRHFEEMPQRADTDLPQRMVSQASLTQLRDAWTRGVPPGKILGLCYDHAPRTWNQRTPLTPTEARAAARELRQIAQYLRRLLPRTVLPIGRPAATAHGCAPLHPVNPTAPPGEVLQPLPLIGLEAMRTLWQVAGTGQGREAPPTIGLTIGMLPMRIVREDVGMAQGPGLLRDLADALEALAPSLEAVAPRHRRAQRGRRSFARQWHALAVATAGHPLDELGAYFLAVTFGLSADDAGAPEAFARLRARAAQM